MQITYAHLYDIKYFDPILIRKNLCDVLINVLNFEIIVSEFELQSCYYIHFRTNTLGKAMDSFSPQLYHYWFSTKIVLALNSSWHSICHSTKKPIQTKSDWKNKINGPINSFNDNGSSQNYKMRVTYRHLFHKPLYAFLFFIFWFGETF